MLKRLKWWHWALIGLGAVSLLGGGSMIVLKQADPRWGGLSLGGSNLGKSGCMITVLTMAANKLLGTNYTPDQVLQKAQQAGGLSGALALPAVIAKALGFKAPDATRIAIGTPVQCKTLIDQTLNQGGVAICHVDYSSDGSGDHFILITGRQGAGYVAADPAPGVNITLDDNLRGISPWGGGKQYQVTGVRQALA